MFQMGSIMLHKK